MAVLNQKTIKVNKDNKTSCRSIHYLPALNYTAGNLQTTVGFKLYIYIAKNPNNYNFDLSSSHFCKWAGCARTAYNSAVKELIDKGYLVKDESEKNHFKFYEYPRTKEELEKYKKSLFLDYTSELKYCKSENEKNIYLLLKKGNIPFVYDKTFSDCLDKTYLPFDFYINNNYIVEYDGQQHFKNIKFFNFETIRKHDLIKNKYCFENNIPLIRIPYDAEYNLKDLVLETTRFLLTPENEQKYYNR